MSVDMSKACELAKANIHKRPAGAGRLAGKVAIVTGSAQGFGKGIAEEMYKEGAAVVIADMNEPLAKSVAESLGERACCIPVNVSDEAGRRDDGAVWRSGRDGVQRGGGPERPAGHL